MKFDDTARFFGPSEKLWPELFVAPTKLATTLCRDCRKVFMPATRRFCDRCAKTRKRTQDREAQRRKRGLNVRKTANSPVRAETLTRAD